MWINDWQVLQVISDKSKILLNDAKGGNKIQINTPGSIVETWDKFTNSGKSWEIKWVNNAICTTSPVLVERQPPNKFNF